MKVQRLVFAIALGSVFFFSLSTVSNALGGGWGGKPAYPDPDNPRTESIYVLSLEPGTSHDDGVLVVNNSEETKSFYIYAQDSAPSSDGGFACQQLGEESTDVGSWVTLEKDEVTLEPSGTEVVAFTVDVPEDVDIGEHNGCILIQDKAVNESESSGLRLSLRTAIRMAITIPGDIVKELEIVDFTVEPSGNAVVLTPSIRNLGNVSVDTTISTETKSILGTAVGTTGGTFPVLRDEAGTFNLEIDRPFWGGWYRSDLTVEYDANPDTALGEKEGATLTQLTWPPVWFFVMPTTPGLAIEGGTLLFVLVLFYLMVVAARRKRWVAEKWIAYTVVDGDNLQSLAKTRNVSWKLLAKMNKLKPPYILSAGKEIRIPPSISQ
jgi:hypothetical protein